MSIVRPTPGRATRRAALACAALTSLMFYPARAAVDNPLILVEQDWELMVGDPDANICSPQVYLQMNPFSGQPKYCLFLINHSDVPGFNAGGLQVQIWNDTDNLTANNGGNGQAVLQTSNEKITFTLSMQSNNGTITFGVKNVTSSTWNIANGLSTTTDYWLPFFLNYQTSDTINNSGILLGSNRVKYLKLKQVRKTDVYGTVTQENGQTLFNQSDG